MNQLTAFDCPNERTGQHEWSHSADYRYCRLCGKSESRGSTACFSGHDWCNEPDWRTCRKCGRRESTRQDARPGFGR